MRIKIHKGFRGLLSLLVTLMLLVGVMPLSAVSVNAASCTVYFAKDMGMAYFGGEATGNNVWIHDGSTYPQMESVNNNLGFEIYKYTFTAKPANTNFSANYKNTVDIQSADIHDGYLYYCKDNEKDANGNNTGKYTVASFPYSQLTYTPLTTTGIFSSNMGKDVNVIVDSSGTDAFTQEVGRHYANAIMYDYFSDYELENGVKRTNITNEYGSWENPYRRMPLLTFDEALSNFYGSGYNRPLYFGDIHHEWNGYDFKIFNKKQWNLMPGSKNGSNETTEDAVYRQLYNDNNSARRWAIEEERTEKDRDAATMGLYASSLGTYTEKSSTETFSEREARMLNNAKRLQLSSGKDAKWFDSTWLSAGTGDTHNSTGHMIGASYAVDFPFWELKNLNRTITINGSAKNYTGDYYYINSEKPEHALRMHKDTTGKYYLDETGEGIYNFSGNDAKIFEAKKKGTTVPALTTTYGFFPFNSKSDFYDSTINNYNDLERADLKNLMDYKLRFDRTNYGFGVYMEIPFTLTSNNGTVNGTTDATDTPITFTFSGDDDLLVYIDGKLVLDVGGDHGKVQGEINLQQKKSWVFKAKRSSGNNEETGVTWTKGDGEVTTDVQNITVPSSITNSNGVKNLDAIDVNICKKGEHVMEIFYVERGLFDSNMEIMYNLPVVENRSFTVGQSITTPAVDSVFTSSQYYSTNVSNIRLDMNVQFSEPNDTSTFDKLLNEQTYPGDNPKKITGITGVTEFDSDTTTHTYSVKMGNNNTITYLNNFIKPYNYNLKVSEGNIFIKTGIDENGKEICTDTNRNVSHLFTTSWKLRQLSNAANEKTYQDAGPATTATATTSGSSRPKRAAKTTSTSATNNSNGFDFRGTQANPDEIEFYNTMNTYPLRVSKEFHRKTDDTATRTFTIKVYFNNVGGLNLEEPNAAIPASEDNNGLGIVLERELTFTFSPSEGTGTDGTTKYKDIVVPANTVYKVIETTAQTSDGYAKSGEVGADNDAPFAEPVLDENNRVSVTVVNRAPQAIILKVQKVWENTTSSTVFPASVKFLVEKSTDGTTFSHMTSGTVVNASGQTVSGDALNSGYLTLTNAYTTTINGNTVWLAYIYDDGNVSTNTYRVTEYDSNTPLGEGATYKPTASSFKVKYSETGFTSESTYANDTENNLTTPAGVSADYGNGSAEGGRVLTLSVINRAFIKIRVQSYFTQTDENLVAATPTSVKMRVQRLNTSNNQWVAVSNSENTNTSEVSITTTQTDTETNPSRVYFEYVLAGEYDPDYQYRVLEYTQDDGTTPVETPDGNTNFNTAFTTISYSFDGGDKKNNREGTDLDKVVNNNVEEFVLMTDTNNHSGYGITLAVLNSGDGSQSNTNTGGRGGYIPIAGGFIAILLAGAGYFIYKKRIFA